ncbi:class I lanthipeptide [Joostella atrarenae]|uniref:Class I lanthipeptide n=1 Tax=Joostella atrarenae TaxID=679257 RepID=A0ABS9J7E5_9FLAO|nr:class I lanthipeptide [Joostella atrarenae]MCF8716356.1 class I lanthipeptide [Joostella atrarenae]
MKKRKLSGLSLNKKKVSELNETITNMLKGGGTGYVSCAIQCGGGGNHTFCIYSCSCTLGTGSSCP